MHIQWPAGSAATPCSPYRPVYKPWGTLQITRWERGWSSLPVDAYGWGLGSACSHCPLAVCSACRHVLIVVPKGFVFSYGVLVEKSAMSFSVATGFPGTVNLLHHHRAQSRALGELGISCVFRSFFYRCAFPFLGKCRVWQPFTPLPWALPSSVWSLANQGRQPSCCYCWSCNK